MNFEEIYLWIKSFEKIERMTTAERTAKLLEEAGEFSAEILRSLGHKKQKYNAEELMDHILEEGCDVIISILPLFVKFGFTNEQITDKMKTKINIWLKKIDAESYMKEE
jgi:hypothetical protein